MTSVHLTRLLFTLWSTLALTACLDDGGSGNDDTSVGRIHYNGFSGLTYQTASQRGTTNDQGEFRYYPGETLSLWVGDLKITDGVPAQKYVTLLEFFPDIRAALNNPAVDDERLSTHTTREQRLLDDRSLKNVTRFLIALNWTENVRKGEGIEIRDRVIDQLNAALPSLTAPIDFTVSEAEFTALGETPSPANQLLAAICFYPEGNFLCENPPSLEEIAAAPSRPEDEADRDPETVYQEDLQTTRDRILEAIRTIDDIDSDDVDGYLTRELTAITTAVSNRYYLNEDVVSHPASDTAIKTVRIRRIGSTPELADVEAISTRPSDVMINATGWQEAEVEYFVAGETGGESELVVSFRPDDTYRWIRKQLRVVIR